MLIDLGYIRERDLVRALAEQVGLEFVDLTEYRIDAASTALLPEALCRRYRALPIGEDDGKLLVAMSDPANVYALDDIRTITGREVRPVVATAHDVEQAIAKFSGMGDQVEALASEAERMGGGVGVSVHGSHRVASENIVFAMPEVGIGLFPDVGASHVLSETDRNLGLYLGLSAARLGLEKATAAGVVTHPTTRERLRATPDFELQMLTQRVPGVRSLPRDGARPRQR